MTMLLDHPATLDVAIEKSGDFLLAAQDANGGWRDFLLPAGLSDSWVTAYVAEALVGSGEQREKFLPAARRAWTFLHGTETEQGGWSYNPQVPGDADSTLWGLRLAVALGEEKSDLACRAVAFLDRHLRPDKGLSTYATAELIRGYTGMPAAVPFDGWTQSHACVSAAGANLARYADRLIPYLLAKQDRDGSWPAYFWFDREYSTGEAVSALMPAKSAAGALSSDIASSIDRAVVWLTRRATALAAAEGRVRPAFALACAAKALALVARTEESREAVARVGATLAAWQRDSGSWGPSARLRVPPPYAMVPPEEAAWTRWEGPPSGAVTAVDKLKSTFTNFTPDHRGLFGAATALRALRQIAVRGQT
jgi:hypothetical protein